MGIDKVILQLATPFYYDLPYHNISHAIDVGERVNSIADRCERHGIRVRRETVYAAGVWHDAEYPKDFRALGYSTREELAAATAGDHLVVIFDEPGEIEEVMKCIRATESDAVPHTVEQKIVRAADLMSLAGEYGQFVKNTALLKEEEEMLSGRKVSDEDWKEATRRAILRYLAQDIRLTPEHDTPDGLSFFHTRTRENLERYLREH